MESLKKKVRLPWVISKEVHLQRPLELARFALRRHAESCLKLMRGTTSTNAERDAYVLKFDGDPGQPSGDAPQIFYQAIGTQGVGKGQILGYNFHQATNAKYYGVLSNLLSHGTPLKCAYAKLPKKICGCPVEWLPQEGVRL